MADKRKLEFPGPNTLALPKTSASSLKEQAARTILRNVRSQGHPYVELRQDGKKFIYFCTLCLAPCYGEAVLLDHLKGNLHNDRLSFAKLTLLGPNPWPFNDGVLFFNDPSENDKQIVVASSEDNRLLEPCDDDNNLAIIKYGENIENNGHRQVEVDEHLSNEVLDYTDFDSCAEDMTRNAGNSAVVIPGVRIRDQITNLEATEVGFGLVAARLLEKDDVSFLNRIWCEWLGQKAVDSDDDDDQVLEHDFAIVTFSYNMNLGKTDFLDDVKFLLPGPEVENFEGNGRKRKSFSDPEDTSENSSSQYDTYGEDSSASSSVTSRLLLNQCDDQLLHTRFKSRRALRKELRRKQRIAAEKMCDICQHKMLPGKDVATLMNLKTGRLACSSRNVNGAFHVFHISCLIHWVLLCEMEIMTNPPKTPEVRRRSRRKNAAKGVKSKEDIKMKALNVTINSVLCPECQGTGTIIDGDEVEKPNIPVTKMFKYKIKVSDARRAWMKSPEALQNCSTGFHLPSQSEETLKISSWMTDNMYFNISPKDAGVRLELIHRVHGMDRAECYFNNMSEKLKTQNVYGALLCCYVRENSVEKAEAVMRQMRKKGMAESSFPYNMLINLYSQNAEHNKIDMLTHEMENKGIAPDKFTLRNRIAAYVAANDISGIGNILNRMKDCQFDQDWEVCSIAAKGYLKAGFEEKALLMLRKMEEMTLPKGKKLAFEFLLTLYASTGHKDELYRVWNKYKPRSEAMIYACMIRCLAKLDDIEGAERIFKEWESKCRMYDFRVLNRLLTAYCKRGLLNKAESTVNKAVEGRTPYASTWSILAYGYVEQKQLVKAVEMLKKALAVGRNGWMPNPSILTACLDYLEEQRDARGMGEIIDLLSKLGPLNRDLYNRLLRTSIEAGESVSTVLDQMKKLGFTGDEKTHQILETQNM